MEELLYQYQEQEYTLLSSESLQETLLEYNQYK
jgi:hypothetical protein